MRKIRIFCNLPVVMGVLSALSCTFNIGNNNSDPTPPTNNRTFYDDTIPVASLDWPAVTDSLPSCNTLSLEFALPDLPAPDGRINLIPSATLQPVGISEKLFVEIRDSNTSDIDPSVNGTLRVVCDSNTTVSSSDAVSAGTSSIHVRFNSSGVHTLTATVVTDSDTLHGTVAIMAFMPQLPIVEMNIKATDYNTILNDPYEKISVPATLTYNGTTYPTEARLHGGSSRDYPKKSFRFDLADAYELPDTHDHLIFRAEWNDKTMLRNYLCLQLARHGTWLAVPKAEMVHFRINGRFYGVMWRVERIGGDFLRIRGLNNQTGSMYEADPESDCFTPGGNMTALSSDDEYRCAYAMQKGDLDYADLIALIEETLQLPDEGFADTINDVVRVNDMLCYFAFMAVIQNHDHIKKNYYLYRDPQLNDDRWTIFPWDLELTLGHLWTEANDVLDETIFTEEPLDFGAESPPVNTLFSRLYDILTYRRRFDEMVEHLLETVFTEAFIEERIDNILCRATYDILADGNKRADNGEYLQRVEEISNFITERRAFISNEWLRESDR